jgi:hypothetical protein
MRLSRLLIAWVVAAILSPGCHLGDPNAGHSDVRDASFHRRHPDPKSHYHRDPVMVLARDVTSLEADLRRDGTITVKKPDVWGDGNLMHSLQEFDRLLAKRTEEFDETLQAYIARSDAMEVQSTTGIASALSGGGEASAPSATMIEMDPINVFELINQARVAAPPKASSIGVEPTELARQLATYIDVCQSLRRRHMGDDNSRAAGYGLYKFRIPVSVLPGRETNEGHAAVVTLRAQLEMDAAHLRYTFPKLAIADLADLMAPLIQAEWGQADLTCKQREKARKIVDELRTMSIAQSSLQATIDRLVRAYDAADPELKVRLVDEFVKCERPKIESARTQAEQSASEQAALAEAAKRESEMAQNEFETRSEEHKSEKDAERAKVLQRDVDRFKDEARIARDKAEIAAKKSKTDDARAQDLRKVIEALPKVIGIPIGSPPIPSGIPTQPSKLVEVDATFGRSSRLALREAAEKWLGPDVPKLHDLRTWLFAYLGQIHNFTENNNLYVLQAETITGATRAVVRGHYHEIEAWRCAWLECWPHANADQETHRIAQVSWMLAIQSGILDHNLKLILEELKLKGKLSEEDWAVASSGDVMFFALPSTSDPRPETVRLWQTLIRGAFPLHVFTLDPQVEEQNVYDAFSRRREMQLALAYGVARGGLNMNQRVAMSRQLALDEATIGLNRTVVGFSHGEDTFGWYFYPRVQTPPTESSNVGALARMIWSTGPTEHYDLKHRNLEPGMRECEVLVVMPSFVTQVSFDVTTNWEKLAKPGVTKRSYEEMLVQGRRVHQMKVCLREAGNQACYRPGDYQRLLSRIDQLEQMLGMQTYLVNVPYEYEQSGKGLFDRGDTELRPFLTGYYGLEFIQADVDTAAYLFVTGRHFHPTLTHVVVGGLEAHSVPEGDNRAEVEVISRELLMVKVGKVNRKLSAAKGFELRVGTPSGLSNPITVAPATPPAAATANFSFKHALVLDATVYDDGCKKPKFCLREPGESVFIKNNTGTLFAEAMDGHLVVRLTAKTKTGVEVLFGDGRVKSIDTKPIPMNVSGADGQVRLAAKGMEMSLQKALEAALNADTPHPFDEPFEITVTGFITLEKWPFEQLGNPIKIEVRPTKCCPNGESGAKPSEKRSTLEVIPSEPIGPGQRGGGG